MKMLSAILLVTITGLAACTSNPAANTTGGGSGGAATGAAIGCIATIPHRLRSWRGSRGCNWWGRRRRRWPGIDNTAARAPAGLRACSGVRAPSGILSAAGLLLSVAGAIVKTEGWSAYPGAPGVRHDRHVIGSMAAHVALPWVHRIFSNLKVWALGVYHGLRRRPLQSYLDEFAFRFNRCRTRHAAFRALLSIAVGHPPLTYQILILPEATV